MKRNKHVRFRVNSGFLGYFTHLVVVVLGYLRMKFILLILPTAFLRESGWTRSSKLGFPVDKNGSPLPWFPLNLIKFLDSRIGKDHVVFEFGTGGSTIWFSERVGRVVSVEHDKEWYATLSKKLESTLNVDLILHALEGNEPLLDLVFMKGESSQSMYASEILSTDFVPSIIVVDGIDRLRCIINAIKVADSQTVILVDNLEYREEFMESLLRFKSAGFKCIEFWGLAPGAVRETCTGLFYKSDNTLGI